MATTEGKGEGRWKVAFGWYEGDFLILLTGRILHRYYDTLLIWILWNNITTLNLLPNDTFAYAYRGYDHIDLKSMYPQEEPEGLV